MQLQEVIERLSALADDTSISEEDKLALQEGLKVVRIHANRPSNSGKPWTVEEEARLAAGHAAGQSPRELAAMTRRSRGAVKARLVKLGLIDASEAGSLRYRV